MKTDKILGFAAAILLAAAALVSCDPLADSYSGKDVSIEISIDRLSAGFAQISYTPSDNAYYIACVDKVIPGINPDEHAQAFMDLALDSCYVKYVEWRHTHLKNMETDIADFPSHMMNYGPTTIIHNFLDPDTDYWVYCFVVDANSNKANGNLYWTTIHTQPESVFENIRFRYRVNGEWDYVYPYDKETGEVVTYVPWVGKTMDSLELKRFGRESPGAYFDYEFTQYNKESKNTFIGIYAHQNNGTGDGTSYTEFKEGHTYYTAMAVLDGPRNQCYDVYKFTWHGQDTEYFFTDESSTGGDW